VTTTTEKNEFSPTTSEEFGAWSAQQSAVILTREGIEIMAFHDEKAAGAWCQHVYGETLRGARVNGFELVRLANRQPKPGDAVIYDGSGAYTLAHGRGVLDAICGELACCFAASAFRVDDSVSCSGGPLPFIDPADLRLVGLYDQRFWRWHAGYSGAGQGGDYYMTVPLWRWNGGKE
jgi:hypothetical protein